MNSDDFFTSLPSQRLDVFETEINSLMEVEEQIKILLSCEDDPEMRADFYQYWLDRTKEPNYDENQFLKDLLKDNFSFDE